MKSPLVPAALAFRQDGTPFSPLYDDVYHSAAGGLAQAQQVFLHGNGLPERWRERRVFTVMETGFGMGLNFLASWAAWRADAARCERLHFVSVEKHPFKAADLRAVLNATLAGSGLETLAHALVDAWPALVGGTHRLEFEDGRVTLTLAFGDAERMLPALWLRADAFYLDGFSPAKNPQLWTPQIFRALARVAGEGATLATWSSAGHVRRGLTEVGFDCTKVDGFGTKRTMLTGRFAPRWRVRRYEPPLPLIVDERHAIVIGAGLAGCAAVERLAARGWRISLLEREAAPARHASGNRAGVFHPLISRDDGTASRITRAGFFYALQRWAVLAHSSHTLLRGPEGLLQLAESDEEWQAMSASLAALGWPDGYVKTVSRSEASKLAGLPLARGGWFHLRGGWVDPVSLCEAQCEAAGTRLERHFNVEAARVEREGQGWAVFDRDNACIARAPVVIFANAHDAARTAALRHAPTRAVRGQLTCLPPGNLNALRLPLIGNGYAVPLPDRSALIGATYEVDDLDAVLRADGHAENLQRVASMLPTLADAQTGLPPDTLTGRVAFRCVTSDRLPMLGALADETAALDDAPRLRGAWPRDLPRLPGLYGAFGYGSRGLVWSSLGAELLAAQIEGEPWPLERELGEAMDPARFLIRTLRQGPT